MKYARKRSKAGVRVAPGAREPQPRSVAKEAGGVQVDTARTLHRRRIALIAAVAGGTLNRLYECIRQELASMNGDRGCERLKSGDVECSCEYCELFWSRLEDALQSK